MLGCVGIQRLSGFLQEEYKVLCLGGILWVFPVDIDAVEAEVSEELDGCAGKGLPPGGCGGGSGEVGAVGPAADGEEGF